MSTKHRQASKERDQTIEAEVLGKGLGEDNLVALVHEEPDGKGVLVRASAGKALVGHVKEDKELALPGQLGDLLPLLLAGVHTGGIVGAGMEENHGLLGGGLEILNKPLEVKPAGLGVVVPVILDLNARVVEDGDVVAPGRVGDVDGLGLLVEFGKEFGANPERTGTGDGLAGSNLFTEKKKNVMSFFLS